MSCPHCLGWWAREYQNWVRTFELGWASSVDSMTALSAFDTPKLLFVQSPNLRKYIYHAAKNQRAPTVRHDLTGESPFLRYPDSTFNYGFELEARGKRRGRLDALGLRSYIPGGETWQCHVRGCRPRKRRSALQSDLSFHMLLSNLAVNWWSGGVRDSCLSTRARGFRSLFRMLQACISNQATILNLAGAKRGKGKELEHN